MIKKTIRVETNDPTKGGKSAVTANRKSVIEYRFCGLLIYKKELFHPANEGDTIYYSF